MAQLSTPICKLRKGKEKIKESSVDPSSVQVLVPVESKVLNHSLSSLLPSTSPAQSQLSFCKELEEIDEKLSLQIARSVALINVLHLSQLFP